MSTLSLSIARALLEEVDRREDLTPADLARRVGAHKSTVHRHLHGESKMFIDDMEAYAGVLGWTLEELIEKGQELAAQDPGLPDDPYALAAKKRPKPPKD